MQLAAGQIVTRKPCPDECSGTECPRMLPAGVTGSVVSPRAEPWVWARKDGSGVRSKAYEVEWKARGTYWTPEHCIDDDDNPNFPDAVWTE